MLSSLFFSRSCRKPTEVSLAMAVSRPRESTSLLSTDSDKTYFNLPGKNVENQLKIPNLFPCLRSIFHKATAIILYSNAVFYMTYSCIQASLASLLQEHYGLSILEVGFCYLAFGSATSYGVGMIADYNYQPMDGLFNTERTLLHHWRCNS